MEQARSMPSYMCLFQKMPCPTYPFPLTHALPHPGKPFWDLEIAHGIATRELAFLTDGWLATDVPALGITKEITK